jgi:hypothetical protein
MHFFVKQRLSGTGKTGPGYLYREIPLLQKMEFSGKYISRVVIMGNQ